MRLLAHRHSRSSLLCLLVAAGSGCATIKSGPYGVPLDGQNRALPANAAGPLKVSAGESAGLASSYFGLVEVTFENETPRWIQIDRVDLDFGTADKNRSVLVPWGDDIDVWERAITVRNAVDATNRGTALQVLAIAGAFGSAAGRGHGRRAGTMAAIGGMLEIGALGSIYGLDREHAAAEAAEGGTFSGSHLLNMPIRVPPGLFTKRWILLYTAARPLGGCIDSVILSYDTSTQEHGRVLLKYKDVASQWQTAACGPPATAFDGQSPRY